MNLLFETTALWERTLAPRESDPQQIARDRLRSAFLNMRENAKELVKLIPADCRGLTVHDVSHLDALWEMADMICGAAFEINPAEAFVFGASVLVHDAGMSIASYPGGMQQLKKTTEWRDSAFSTCRAAGISPTDEVIADPPTGDVLSDIVFSVLRALHAKHAEELVFVTWPLPGSKDSVRLLEDNQLRTSYGRTIGQIAHSHNWNIEKVTQHLRTSVGAAADLPQDWKVDEVKLACLLRCADAAHIDHRRAPSMLYALRQPKGVALRHWNFQNKLNKPTISSGALIYSSGEHFGQADAQAWWLCYDTIRMINKELQDSNAILQDNSLQPFAARRVYGAEGPSILARQVQVVGWRPVDAEIRVTDPVNLARTLGGKNLYGDNVFAPIREVLQNAVDAVRARRRIENRPDNWGKDRLILEGKQSELLLHVDDTGIGMSERTLVGPLLDFGNSFWNSPSLREEWPGLESSGLKPIGKFGIGFFAIFILGDCVNVISRRFDAAASDTRCLEFTSIVGRPILRDARPGELPSDFNTRVSVKIAEKVRRVEEDEYSYESSTTKLLASAFGDLRRLISAVDVEIELSFKTANKTALHLPDWLNLKADDFLDEVLANVDDEEEIDRWKSAHSNHLACVQDENGTGFGRAAITRAGDASIKGTRRLFCWRVRLQGRGLVCRSNEWRDHGCCAPEGKKDRSKRGIGCLGNPASAIDRSKAFWYRGADWSCTSNSRA